MSTTTTTPSSKDVQAKIDAATAELLQTTKSGAAMVKDNGADWTKWPKGHWVNGLTLLDAAKDEAGLLVPPPLQPPPPVPPTPPPPTPTPPPTSAVALFDGTAKTYWGKHGQLPTTSGVGSATTLHPYPPPPDFDGYTYMNADIVIAPDPRFGYVFKIAPPAGDHSPYNTGAPVSTSFAQLSKGRPAGLGSTDWFALSLKLLSFDIADWASFLSMGYETLQWDQMALQAHSDGKALSWAAYMHSGEIANGQATSSTVNVAQPLLPVVVGRWEDWVMGVRWATDSTGFFEIWHRPEGGSWTQVFLKNGVPTYLWGTNPPYGAVTPDMQRNVLDKGGYYCGWWDANRTPAPTASLLSSGWSRWGHADDAKASIPA